MKNRPGGRQAAMQWACAAPASALPTACPLYDSGIAGTKPSRGPARQSGALPATGRAWRPPLHSRGAHLSHARLGPSRKRPVAPPDRPKTLKRSMRRTQLVHGSCTSRFYRLHLRFAYCSVAVHRNRHTASCWLAREGANSAVPPRRTPRSRAAVLYCVCGGRSSLFCSSLPAMCSLHILHCPLPPSAECTLLRRMPLLGPESADVDSVASGLQACDFFSTLQVILILQENSCRAPANARLHTGHVYSAANARLNRHQTRGGPTTPKEAAVKLDPHALEAFCPARQCTLYCVYEV